MYQRHSFGAPPPIFTPPPAPYNPKHRAYARPTAVPHQDVVPPQVVIPHQDVVPHQAGGFPSQLSLRTTQLRAPQPVPAIAFSDNITQSVADIFNKKMNIYVTPTDYFTTTFRQIFTKTQIKFTTAKYARKWLAKPDMSFWPQQLNFALWCATTGCGVSREMLFPNTGLNLSEHVRTFYQFHVYYTTRKILYEMGGIQSKNALPDDPAFNQQDNPYDVASYKRICAEFGIDPSTDFRFTYGQNHGLGYVNIMYSDGPFAQKQWKYPPADLSNSSSQRLAGEQQHYHLHKKRPGCRQAVRALCAKLNQRSHTKRSWQDQPLNRGFRLLHLGRTGRNPQQYSGQPRYCEKHANRLPCPDRGLNKDPERIEWASEVSRRYKSYQGAVKLSRRPGCLATTCPHDYQHGEHSRLQQQPAEGNR